MGPARPARPARQCRVLVVHGAEPRRGRVRPDDLPGDERAARPAGAPGAPALLRADPHRLRPDRARRRERVAQTGHQMGIRTGRDYIDSLRDGRQMWIDGELAADVTTDRRFAAAAYTMAELYDMQHDPALADRLTYASPTSGERVGLSFIQPKCVDDLVRRREMVKVWMDATCGMFGRSPDFMNITVTAFASASQAFGERDKKYGENIWNYYLHCREHEIAMTHTLINPQVDRSKPVEKQEKDLAAKIVKETDAGIVISGARMVSTLCAYSHDLLVMPSTYLANNEEARPSPCGFAIPV